MSHSAGAVDLDLNGCDADLAVGCGYKYLNGGPGAPAFLFIARRLQNLLQSPLSGWMGHAKPFEFGDDYEPAPGLSRFLCGTPPILAMTALDQALDLLLEATMPAIENKARALTDLFIAKVKARCADGRLKLVTPHDFYNRGSHVALTHPNAYEICQALIAGDIVGDFRAPDVLRFGFAPLYNQFADVWHTVNALADIMADEKWDQPQYRLRGAVT